MIAIVEFARAHGMQVTAQRTGHNAEPLGVAGRDDPRQDRRDAGRRDRRRAARSPASRAGAKWGDVVPQASDLGLAALHGSTPDVSVAGYSLGGGVGWYARKLGLSDEQRHGDRARHRRRPSSAASTTRTSPTCSGRCAAAAATSASSPRSRSSSTRSPRSTPASSSSRGSARPRCCTRGASGRQTVPDEITSVGRILQFPPIPEVPEPLRGQKFAIVEAHLHRRRGLRRAT